MPKNRQFGPAKDPFDYVADIVQQKVANKRFQKGYDKQMEKEKMAPMKEMPPVKATPKQPMKKMTKKVK